jgi:hypothetical protein
MGWFENYSTILIFNYLILLIIYNNFPINMDVQGIPSLSDLTQPEQLRQFSQSFLHYFLLLTVIVVVFGIVLSLFNFGLRNNQGERDNILNHWIENYQYLIRGWQQAILVVTIIIIGYYLCSTLAIRYHFWEQAKIQKISITVAGSRLEQVAPKLRYQIQEPYSFYSQIGGNLTKIEEIRPVDRYLSLTKSDIKVTIDQFRNPQTDQENYTVNFEGVYQATNSLQETKDLYFEVNPPSDYILLQGFRVERGGKKIEPENPGNYSFLTTLKPNQSQNFRVSYQAQGSPKWVYNAQGEILNNFRLVAIANFSLADFASGIQPTNITDNDGGTTFTWEFNDNVSVQNPFGVFTATESVKNTGVIPRLLILAPAIFLWWLLLLYLSFPLIPKEIAMVAGIYFASILALTYSSRITDIYGSWAIISLILLCLIWGLGKNKQEKAATIICTISGLIIPVIGFLVPYTGITLSIAGLLSVTWLVIINWYMENRQ